MILIKSGVRISKLRGPMVAGWMIVAECFEAFGYDCTVTSGEDGTHLSQSLHYDGLALDFRTHHVERSDLDPLLDRIAKSLGDGYDWVLEQRDKANEHLHVEYDPR